MPESSLPEGYRLTPWFDVLTLEVKPRDPSNRQAFTLKWPVYHLLSAAAAGRSERWVGVPRFWGLSLFGPPKEDNRVDGDALGPDVRFRGPEEGVVLRDVQVLALREAVRTLDEWGGTFIEAAPGIGKTLMATWLICNRGRKAAVCAPSLVLLEQWKRALQLWAPALRVVELRTRWNPTKTNKDHMRIASGDWDVLISTSDSLSQCDYPSEFVYDRVGTLVVDEAHHIASKTLCQIAPRFPARNVVGLSATPNRQDGLEHALYWLLGPPCFRYQRVPSITGKIHTVEVRRLHFADGRNEVVHNRDGEVCWSGCIRALAADEGRNALLVAVVARLLGAEGRRRVIVLTLLREHVETLAASVAALPGMDPARVAVLMGGASAEDRAKATNVPVVVGTMQFLEEGYDDDELDTLVLAMPRSSEGSLRQIIGRVERAREGKLKPIVVDVLDEFSIFRAIGYKRSRFYAEQGWKIRKQTPEDIYGGATA